VEKNSHQAIFLEKRFKWYILSIW